ncbi:MULTISPECIES: hypothetical protein [Rhizobium]|uniref:Uncharacterized protein n=1 Tax=Rhizobium tropici TaxID=398 RepID=A0A6P1C347_RHITR|nr:MULTISPECIES: hypothetical protein [Rhizobium]MBB4239372.1 hypothetical protein [Rhizobium tropici]MBB5590642.1 hypothetical protein [Rhizobium tropici]MBB6490149.1 hypothetical protein [Rhizobium tropici]NEV09364.1 hypothetical protein [Rhizobium tropici]
MGESTDAVAKMAPAATEVKSFPVIVNLPFILMGMLRHTRMLTSASGTFAMPAVIGPVLEAMAQGGFGSVKSCRKLRRAARKQKEYVGKSIANAAKDNQKDYQDRRKRSSSDFILLGGRTCLAPRMTRQNKTAFSLIG